MRLTNTARTVRRLLLTDTAALALLGELAAIATIFRPEARDGPEPLPARERLLAAAR